MTLQPAPRFLPIVGFKNPSPYLYDMTTLTLNVPNDLGKDKQETIQFIAAKLYEAGKVSLSQGAEICSMKKWDFAEILINYGVHYLDQSAEADLGNG